MDITSTTTSKQQPFMHTLVARGTLGPRGEATPLPAERAADIRAPTMIDIAAARSLAWMMNHLLRTIGTNLEFVVQAESGAIVVRVLDKATGALIRHIPVEALPGVAAVLEQSHGGLIRDMA